MGLRFREPRHYEHFGFRLFFRDAFCKFDPIQTIAHAYIGEQDVNVDDVSADLKGFDPAAGRKHDKALPFQRGGDKLPHCRIIFGKEDNLGHYRLFGPLRFCKKLGSISSSTGMG